MRPDVGHRQEGQQRLVKHFEIVTSERTMADKLLQSWSSDSILLFVHHKPGQSFPACFPASPELNLL